VESDGQLAIRIAEEAGALLMEMRSGSPDGGPALAKAGDRAAHELIVSGLTDARPEDAVISEEDDRDRWPWPRPDRQWIVDPLDGTREYGEGRTDFAVHVALVVDHEAVIGAVALPAEGLVLSTDQPSRIHAPPAGTPLRILVSRTRPAREATALAEILSATLEPMGSAGAKTMAVVRGDRRRVPPLGRPVRMGLGRPGGGGPRGRSPRVAPRRLSPRLRQSRPWLPDLLICRDDVAQLVRDGLERIR
jgi:3'(2'), 5'-bisphosphate nucleotidase